MYMIDIEMYSVHKGEEFDKAAVPTFLVTLSLNPLHNLFFSVGHSYFH
jgi:hypothetical protein